MSLPHQPIEQLFEKIRLLSTEQVTEVTDFVDFLRERSQRKQRPSERKLFHFPVISVGQWPQNLPLNREEMYGDDGR